MAELELALSAEDLGDLLRRLKPAGVAATLESVAVAGDELRVRVQPHRLPVPVELVARVARVEPERLVLSVDIGNMGFLPGGLRLAALDMVGRQAGVPGVDYADGYLSLEAGELARALGMRFTLAGAAIRTGHLRLQLQDVSLGGAPEGEVAPAPGAVEHSGPAKAGPADDGAPGEAGPADDGAAAERGAAAPEDTGAAAVGQGAPAGNGGGAGAAAAEGQNQEDTGTYRAVRSRITRFLDRNLPAWLQPAVPWVLLLPDMTVLLARLAADPRVPPRAKVVAAAALAYVAVPVDVLPDILPALGILDDAAVAVLALEALVAANPAAVREHWPGDGDILDVVRDGLAWVAGFFPGRTVQKFRDWLKHGRPGEAAPNAGKAPEPEGPPPQQPVH